MNRYWASLIILAVISFGVLHPQVGQAVTLPDSFPRLGNYYLDPYLSDQEAEALSKWDIVIVGLETHYTSPNAFKIMKEMNPDIIILAYVTSEEVPEKHLTVTDTNSPIYQLYNQLNSNDDLFLKTTDGQYLYFWSGSRMLNVTGAWNSILPTFMTNEVIKKNSNHWDGIFFDNCFNDISWLNANIDSDRNGQADFWKDLDADWKAGMSTMMRNARKQNPKAVLLCNSNGKFYSDINGRLIEAFPSDFDGGWTGSMDKYFEILTTAKQPSVVVVNTVADSFDATNYRLMRYNLTSTLMGNGFASFDASINSHNSTWWYDEYSVALGEPLGGPINVRSNQTPGNWQSGVYRRNFERGIVLVNSTNTEQQVVLEDGFEKILGTQDVVLNNGKIVGSVKIPAHDGIILQGRIAQVLNNPYINGTFAKVLSARGKTVRNSFFTYNSNYSGSETIVRLADKGITVVGGATYVTVYKGSSAIARFAPYGTSYTGEVNVAVGKLNGEKKGYSIVTGMQQGGSQVKIYSLRGKLTSSGCTPYGSGFQGGVNVAVGDIMPNKPGAEIVVGPGKGGGPLVKVLNKRCKEMNHQWFAYNSAYRSGVWVAAGDVNNDGKDDIVTVPGPGAASFVRTWTGRGKEQGEGFYAFPKSNVSGAQVAVSDIDENGKNELIAMSFSIFNE